MLEDIHKITEIDLGNHKVRSFDVLPFQKGGFQKRTLTFFILSKGWLFNNLKIKI